MDRRSFFSRSFLGLSSLLFCSTVPIQNNVVTAAVPMLHDGTRWRKVTELYIDPRCLEDIRRWGVDQIDETTKREIMCSVK